MSNTSIMERLQGVPKKILIINLGTLRGLMAIRLGQGHNRGGSQFDRQNRGIQNQVYFFPKNLIQKPTNTSQNGDGEKN